MAGNAFYKKTGCMKSKSVVRKYNSETGRTFKSARNAPKCREIDRNLKNAGKKSSWLNLKWICKTGSRCILWPTFGEIESHGRRVKKWGRRHISTSGLTSSARGTPLFAVFCSLRLQYRRQTLDMLPISKLGATNLHLWIGSKIRKPEVL